MAEADGSPVPQAAQDSALALAQAIQPGSFSSLHDDLVAGHPMELEALHGFVGASRAAQHVLAVPMSEAVSAILQPWAVRNHGEAPVMMPYDTYQLYQVERAKSPAEIRHADEQAGRLASAASSLFRGHHAALASQAEAGPAAPRDLPAPA